MKTIVFGRTKNTNGVLASFLHRFTRPQRSSLLQCYRSCKYKGLEKGLAGRASKSIAFKSKSSKNGLKSGLESKSGLEYYKSGKQHTLNACQHL